MFLNMNLSDLYKRFIARKVGSVATGKVKTFTDTVLGLL